MKSPTFLQKINIFLEVPKKMECNMALCVKSIEVVRKQRSKWKGASTNEAL